jgi:MFS family permease
MLAPIYALFVDKVGGDILAAGITAAALAFGSGVACLVAGRSIDRMKNKRYLLVGSGIVMAAGFLAYGYAGSVWQLAAIQVVMGVVQAVHATAYDALYTRHLDKNHEGEEWGAWEALYYFATAGGALAGGYLVSRYSFEVLFLDMAFLTFISALYLLTLPKRLL